FIPIKKSTYCPPVERDPKKRRVKPIDTKLLQMNLGELDDSSDDSDYQVPEQEDVRKMMRLLSATVVACLCMKVVSCYGIQDAESVVSTGSSSSTEPWFCDACRGGNCKPTCELCPNSGGIFKETDVGKWVHLVCALYIPGVAFGDVDKLSPACTLCEDERFSRCGVCISCDAGMCRNYFHVTCAQREGLLSEASPEEDIADPFFAYCKMHADKMIVRGKRRNWLALQSQVKLFNERGHLDQDEKARIERKLQHHRAKFQATHARKSPPWVPTQKMPRLLTSSPSACRRLIKKAELLGINSRTLQVSHSTSDSMVDIRRKWHVPPAFTMEFVGYYLDRGDRMVSMQARLDELLTQNSKLQEEEHKLRNKFEHLNSENEQLKKANSELREGSLKLYKMLGEMGTKTFTTPKILKPKESPPKLHNKHGRKLSSDAAMTLNRCGICKKTQDQHLLARCDTCQLHYHLGCLDPPLTRMPKKTKQQGWQCSECDKTDTEEMEEEVDPSAPRKLREHIKEPVKFTPPSISPVLKKGSNKVMRLTEGFKFKQRTLSLEVKKGMKRRLSDIAGSGSDIQQTPEVTDIGKIASQTVTVDVEKVDEEALSKAMKSTLIKKFQKVIRNKDLRTECSKCKKCGTNANLVRLCDECSLCFHFLCLSPPVKKNPKQRGYDWHCENCDPTDKEEEENEIEMPTSPAPKKKKKKFS
uniref:PHD finger protein 14 n=1 Tax=Strigamia maritima TaxID=126957 RepID=T1JG44_STRMM